MSSGTNFLLDNSLRSNNSGSLQLCVPAIGSRKMPVPGQPPEADTFPSARYCLPDSYVMEISIESSRIRLMYVVVGGLEPPFPLPSPPQHPRASRIRGESFRFPWETRNYTAACTHNSVDDRQSPVSNVWRKRKRMVGGEERWAGAKEGDEFSRRELIIESTKFAEFVSAPGILWNKALPISSHKYHPPRSVYYVSSRSF